jgi:hypothetical protein
MTKLPRFQDGFRLLIRPIVRFCIRHSIKIQEAYAILKSEYVEEARREIARRGETITTSKLSVVTGIPRKLISLVGASDSTDNLGSNLILTVVDRWRSLPQYSHKRSSKPRALSCEGAESEFAQLVRSISVDLNPYTVLYELERVQLVRRSGDTVTITGSLFLERNFEKALAMGAEDAEALIRVIEHNVESDSKKHLHLTTTFDNIPDEHLETIRRWILEEGTKYQTRIAQYLRTFDRDSSREKGELTGRNVVQVVTFEFTQPFCDSAV